MDFGEEGFVLVMNVHGGDQFGGRGTVEIATKRPAIEQGKYVGEEGPVFGREGGDGLLD